MKVDDLGPFDYVLDVGGNVGEFAESCWRAWSPSVTIDSFEPIPGAANTNRKRSAGAWRVHELAVSSANGRAPLHVCQNQHSASTMQEPGTLRRERFKIHDVFRTIAVATCTLDDYLADVLHLELAGRVLLKIDVEGHELHALRGATRTLARVSVAIVEVNQEPDIFVGSPPPDAIDAELRHAGLYFVGVAGVQLDPAGEVVQFDGVWSR